MPIHIDETLSSERSNTEGDNYLEILKSSGRSQSPAPYSVSPLDLTYEALPPSEMYPVKSTPVLPEGWDWWVDGQNRLFYIDLCPGQRGCKRCFWEPPIAEKWPHRPPPTGWSRIETLSGRIFWLHAKSGLKSHEYPLDNQRIIFQNGEPTSVHVKGFRSPQIVSLLTKERLVLQDEHVACQISLEVWNNGLPTKSQSILGNWKPWRSWNRNTGAFKSGLDFIIATGIELDESRNKWIQMSERTHEELRHTLQLCTKRLCCEKLNNTKSERPFGKDCLLQDPTWCSEKHVTPETLNAYGLPWHFSPEAPSKVNMRNVPFCLLSLLPLANL